MSIQIAIQLLGGVGIFLFAIKLISDSLQLMAGDRLRYLVGMLTKTPALGVLVGAMVTVLIQSSSATTVMTVSFVDAGLMTLKQAIGVIMGANIGTTITGQIIAIKIKDYAYLFIIIGVMLTFLAKSKTYTYLGNGLLGFGLLFVGMQTMESSMGFLRDRQDIFLMFSQNPLMGVLAGAGLTLLVQSSSATVGLTIALGMQGLLPLDAAIAIIMGDNIGTTVTALLASISTGRTAKQACAAHVLFNVIGVCIFLPLMPLYINFIASTADSIGHQIANAHTLFNVCNTIIFLPFVSLFAAFIRKLLPDAPSMEDSPAKYLDPKLVGKTPVMGVEAVKNECVYMGKLVSEVSQFTEEVFFEGKRECIEPLLELDRKLDGLYKNISNYSDRILRAGIADDAAKALEKYVICAGYMERVGDNCKKMVALYEYRMQQPEDFSDIALRELREMYNDAQNCVLIALTSLSNPSAVNLAEIERIASEVRTAEADLRTAHLARVGHGECNPESGLIFIDVLGAIEHMAYRARKIAQLTSRRRVSA